MTWGAGYYNYDGVWHPRVEWPVRREQRKQVQRKQQKTRKQVQRKQQKTRKNQN